MTKKINTKPKTAAGSKVRVKHGAGKKPKDKTKSGTGTRPKVKAKPGSDTRKKTGTKSKAGTKSIKKNKQAVISRSRSGKSKRKSNLLKLISYMNKLSYDAVDREITKRFKTIIDSLERDITKSSLKIILSDPKSVDLSSYDESIQPYVKHYIFMFHRTLPSHEDSNKKKKS